MSSFKWKTRTSNLVTIFNSDRCDSVDSDMERARRLHTISEDEPLRNGDHRHDNNTSDNNMIENVYSKRPNGHIHHVNGFTPFRINSMQEGLRLADSEADELFAGRRDIQSPEHLEEKSIVSPRGTIRGYKNRVRAGIATFLPQSESEKNKKNYKLIEKQKIVVYTTSMRIIRHTYERCKRVKDILNTHMVRYEERDVFVNRLYHLELMERLENSQVEVPHIFIDGTWLGDANKLVELNETGKLRKIFKNFSHIEVRSSCEKCGGYRFMPCLVCHGSKKSLHRNDFTAEFVALRCMKCDDNGLVRCDSCLDQQE